MADGNKEPPISSKSPDTSPISADIGSDGVETDSDKRIRDFTMRELEKSRKILPPERFRKLLSEVSEVLKKHYKSEEAVRILVKNQIENEKSIGQIERAIFEFGNTLEDIKKDRNKETWVMTRLVVGDGKYKEAFENTKASALSMLANIDRALLREWLSPEQRAQLEGQRTLIQKIWNAQIGEIDALTATINSIKSAPESTKLAAYGAVGVVKGVGKWAVDMVVGTAEAAVFLAKFASGNPEAKKQIDQLMAFIKEKGTSGMLELVVTEFKKEWARIQTLPKEQQADAIGWIAGQIIAVIAPWAAIKGISSVAKVGTTARAVWVAGQVGRGSRAIGIWGRAERVGASANKIRGKGGSSLAWRSQMIREWAVPTAPIRAGAISETVATNGARSSLRAMGTPLAMAWAIQTELVTWAGALAAMSTAAALQIKEMMERNEEVLYGESLWQTPFKDRISNNSLDGEEKVSREWGQKYAEISDFYESAKPGAIFSLSKTTFIERTNSGIQITTPFNQIAFNGKEAIGAMSAAEIFHGIGADFLIPKLRDIVKKLGDGANFLDGTITLSEERKLLIYAAKLCGLENFNQSEQDIPALRSSIIHSANKDGKTLERQARENSGILHISGSIDHTIFGKRLQEMV